MCEGIIDLQGPNTFIVDPVRSYTSLLAKGPKANRPIRTAGKALETKEVSLDTAKPLSWALHLAASDSTCLSHLYFCL